MRLASEETFEIDGHACIRLSDKIDTLFAKGTAFDFLQDNEGNNYTSPSQNPEGFNKTIRAKEILLECKSSLDRDLFDPEETFIGHVMIWSDSFLLRFSRQKENSMWLLVVRICPPPGITTSKEHTFCLAFGPSTLNHDRVIAFYMREIKEKLMKGQPRYYGKEGVNAIVNTSFGLTLYVADGSAPKSLVAILVELHLNWLH